MESRVEVNIEKLYGSRPLEDGVVYNDRKVLIEIFYHQRHYRQGPVPGGFVVDRSCGYCKAFIVDRYDDLLLSLCQIFKDALVETRNDYAVKKKLLDDTRSAVCSLPDPVVVNGTRIAPELLVWIDLEIRRRSSNNVSSTRIISSRPGPYPNNNVSSTNPSSRPRPYPNNNFSGLASMISSFGPTRRRLRSSNSVSSISIDDDAEDSLVIRRRRTMMAKFTMKRLERIRVASRGVTLEQDWCCVLCLESTVTDDDLKVIQLPCKHIFHDNCVVKWVIKTNSCPLCRSHV